MSEPRRAARGDGPGSSHQHRKKLLVESLLLALRHSEVARVVDIGTLEYFLDASYPQMARGETIDLQSFWDILAKEPGIEPRMMFPPLLAYKGWEERLGVTIFLPRACKDLSPDEKKLFHGRCPIKAADLDHLLAQRKLAAPKAPSSPSLARGRDRPHPSVAIGSTILIGVVLAGLSFGIGVWWALRPHSPAEVDVSALSQDIRLEDGHQTGESLSAVIADPEYLKLPREERERRAARTFAAAKRMGIRTMLLMGTDGRVKVTMHDSGAGDKISVEP